MRTIIKLLAAAAVFAFAACGILDSEKDKDSINLDYLRQCVWKTVDAAASEEIPEIIKDESYPIFFTQDSKMVVMHYDGKNYRYHSHYSYEIDGKTHLVRLVNLSVAGDAANGEEHIALLSRLTNHHMVVYFSAKEDSYVCYERDEFPEEEIVRNSFPIGLLP